MRKSEYLQLHDKLLTAVLLKESWKRDELVAAFAEQVGVRWDPEGPELPDVLMAEGCAFVAHRQERPYTTEEWEAIYAEAARRYSALGQLRKWLEEEDGHVYTIRAVLDKLDSLLKEGGLTR